jgi:hypothetical protein
VVNVEETIDKFVEELISAIQEATAASAPRRRPRAVPPPSLPANIQDETRLKNRSVTYRLNEWRNEQRSDTLESLDSEDQSLWKMTKRVIQVHTPSPPLQVPGELAL